MATEKEIQYLKDNFDFKELKKVKFYDREISETDYDKQKERICDYFELKSIFDYDNVMLSAWIAVKPIPKTFSEN